MSMQDPISDMLTRIRNAQAVRKAEVLFPASTKKMAICKVLLDEGYIKGVEEAEDAGKPAIKVLIKYHLGAPVIDAIKRVSKPSQRVYKPVGDIPRVKNGLGVAIVSTSKGVMTGKQARSLGQGGEILVTVE